MIGIALLLMLYGVGLMLIAAPIIIIGWFSRHRAPGSPPQ